MEVQLPGRNYQGRGVVSANPGPDGEQRAQIEALKAEVARARVELQRAQADLTELQKKLKEYQEKERQIAEVMILAQISAQRTEAEARARAEILIQEADEELRRRNQELELLRLKAQRFKKDLYTRIDLYRASLDQIPDISEEFTFTPTLISREKKPV
ncbi:MAG: hypothetical protein GYA42_09460 [Syntrophomonadaceae bacterium]|nr:hypothetical protein [Syntrophomonadaceae bacterium]